MLIRPVRTDAPIAEPPTIRIAAKSLTTGRSNILRKNAVHTDSGGSGHGLSDAPKFCIRELIRIPGRGRPAVGAQVSRLSRSHGHEEQNCYKACRPDVMRFEPDTYQTPTVLLLYCKQSSRRKEHTCFHWMTTSARSVKCKNSCACLAKAQCAPIRHRLSGRFRPKLMHCCTTRRS